MQNHMKAATSTLFCFSWPTGTKRNQEYEHELKEEEKDGQHNVKKEVIVIPRKPKVMKKHHAIENAYENLPMTGKKKQLEDQREQLDTMERSQTEEASRTGNNSEDKRQKTLQNTARCSIKRLKSSCSDREQPGGGRKEEWRKSVWNWRIFSTFSCSASSPDMFSKSRANQVWTEQGQMWLSRGLIYQRIPQELPGLADDVVTVEIYSIMSNFPPI